MGERSLDQWLAWMESHHPRAIELGLERVAAVAGRLGLGPPAAKVVTVAGTNGKGSCVAALEAGLRAAGWRVGCYTSPHLRHYRERLRIDGREVPDAALCSAFARVHGALGGLSLTYFEFGTLAALHLLAAQPLDVWVLEVGLGGRLDAVNLVDADIAVITAIDLDHQDWLGNDREAIGREKAGILRRGRPLVLADPEPPASVPAAAAALEAPRYALGADFDLRPPRGEGATGAWSWHLRDLAGRPCAGELPGLQLPPASVAAALQVLALLGVPLTPAVLAALAVARLPGRFQRALLDGVEVVADVAHNPAAVALLARRLDALPSAGRTCALFAVMADKDVDGMVAALDRRVEAWFLADLPDVPRTLPAADLAACIHRHGHHMISVSRNLRQAWRRALSLLEPGDRLVVFGSFHVVGPVLAWLPEERET